MADKDREEAKKEFSSLHGKEKVQYIFEYYWLYMVVAVVAIAIIIYIIGRHTFNKEPVSCLGVGVHTEYEDPDAQDALDEKLGEQFTDLSQNGEQVFTVYNFYVGSVGGDQSEAYYSEMHLMAAITAKQLDVIVGTQNPVVSDGEKEYLADLSTVFTEEELALIREKADALAPDGNGILTVKITDTDESGVETTTEIPAVICISGANEAIDASLFNQGSYLGIAVNSENLQNARQFVFDVLGISAG